MSSSDPMLALVQNISAALREYDRLVFDELLPHPLGPPASRQDIARMIRSASVPLPPDYISFLELHDGWKNFSGESHILSARDHLEPWTREVASYWTDLWDVPHPNPFAQGAFPILLGKKENMFVVAEKNSSSDQISSRLVMYDYAYEIRRFDSFASLLEHRLTLLRALIERETKGTNEEQDGIHPVDP